MFVLFRSMILVVLLHAVLKLVRLLVASQPAVLLSRIKSASATYHLSVSSIFLRQQISSSHQQAEQGRYE
jgi:hypothetical protein